MFPSVYNTFLGVLKWVEGRGLKKRDSPVEGLKIGGSNALAFFSPKR
jgi:hypothetical protein